MRISELADRVGVPTSTVRYYERIGLLSLPERTSAGYRVYDEDAAARLLFITRARHMGLSCDQVTALLPVWEGDHCGPARERVSRLIDEKQAEIAAQIGELRAFAAELDTARTALEAEPVVDVCRADLTCCVPESGPVALELSGCRAITGAAGSTSGGKPRVRPIPVSRSAG